MYWTRFVFKFAYIIGFIALFIALSLLSATFHCIGPDLDLCCCIVCSQENRPPRPSLAFEITNTPKKNKQLDKEVCVCILTVNFLMQLSTKIV
jgi:hypothetical protein